MLSVGILVPLTFGRLGRSWRHAQNLRNLARDLANDTTDLSAVEEYWEAHKAGDGSSAESGHGEGAESPVTPSNLRYRSHAGRSRQAPTSYDKPHTRARSISDMTAFNQPQFEPLSPNHPVLSLPQFLCTFGPLVFPLYKAALCRKRILFIIEAPVERACNFVYDTSILGNIPMAVSELISVEATRLKPLFSIGVHDIPQLEEEAKKGNYNSVDTLRPDEQDWENRTGWVACTTDEILEIKKNLYDMAITFPPPNYRKKTRSWPKIEMKGKVVQATQRDLRRFRFLKTELNLDIGEASYPTDLREESDSETNSLIPHEAGCMDADEELVCERPSWGELAYNGFLWWASAGEKRTPAEDDEERIFSSSQTPRPTLSTYTTRDDDQDDEEDDLLDPSSTPSKPRNRRRSSAASAASVQYRTEELDIISYFHRLTTRILSTMADIIETNVDEDYFDNAPTSPDLTDRESEEIRRRRATKEVYFSQEDLSRIGLDMWSESDREFAREMVARYFGRVAIVEDPSWNLCGVRCC